MTCDSIIAYCGSNIIKQYLNFIKVLPLVSCLVAIIRYRKLGLLEFAGLLEAIAGCHVQPLLTTPSHCVLFKFTFLNGTLI